jgi:DNA-binding transcriptional MerR regulator
MNPYTIRQLAAQAGLSRATLLYYESAGLLSPACRSASGYRLYGQNELDRLRSIRALRDAGISISAIKDILGDRSSASMRLLKVRLLEIDGEIRALRDQQIMLARLLAQESLSVPEKVADKDAWVTLMGDAGLSDADMHRWHAEFELASPAVHEQFLTSLDLSADEIAEIRNWSRMSWKQ